MQGLYFFKNLTTAQPQYSLLSLQTTLYGPWLDSWFNTLQQLDYTPVQCACLHTCGAFTILSQTVPGIGCHDVAANCCQNAILTGG